MSKLIIQDLTQDRELDRCAARSVLGGINEWIHIPTRIQNASPMSLNNITLNETNYYVDNDYIMIQPQIFNFGHGVANSGSMTYNLNPQLISAASPIGVQS